MADDAAAKKTETVDSKVIIESEGTEQGNESPPDPTVLKSIKIKFGVVKRLTKDKLSYEKEAAQQRTVVTQYEADEKEATILRNARECLKETEMMIPDVCRRLSTAVGELKEIVDTHRGGPVGKSPEFQEALRIMEEASTHLTK